MHPIWKRRRLHELTCKNNPKNGISWVYSPLFVVTFVLLLLPWLLLTSYCYVFLFPLPHEFHSKICTQKQISGYFCVCELTQFGLYIKRHLKRISWPNLHMMCERNADDKCTMYMLLNSHIFFKSNRSFFFFVMRFSNQNKRNFCWCVIDC